MTLACEMKGTPVTSSPAGSKPSICFVALNAYNLLSGRGDIQHIGGAEVQQVRIASWLAQRGFSVRFVMQDHGQPDGLEVQGMKVFKAYAKGDGLRGLRFLHPRWSGLWSAMARADSQIYYQRCAESETGAVASWCRLHRRKFVFASAADSDCDRELLVLKHPWLERVLYRAGVRLAHAIVVQTRRQQELFRQSMRLGTHIVPSCCWSPPDEILPQPPRLTEPGGVHVLWVGRIDSMSKRFEWLLDVARQLPHLTFDVVGNQNNGSPRVVALLAHAAGIPNVTLHGAVPYAEMIRHYRSCHVLCCTSAHEGFPNTFLEAWALGIPVVSTFDPDGVIAAHGLGLVAPDQNDLVACLKRITQAPEVWRDSSWRAKRYCLENHVPEVSLPRLERVFLEVAAR